MWLDVLAGVLFTFLTALGAMRGTAVTLLRILSLAGGYAAAFLAATQLGPLTAQRLDLPDYLGAPAAGVGAFAASYLLLGLLVRAFQWWDRRRRDGASRSALDRSGGALLGAVQGGVIVLLVGWLGLFVEAGQSTGTLEAVPPVASSRVSKATQQVVETGASALLDSEDAGTRVTVKMMTRPKQTVESAQKLLSNPRLDELQRDRLFWSYIENGAIDAGLNRASFLGMAYDSATRQSFADLGLITQREADEPRAFRDAMEQVFRELGPRVKRIRHDPDLAALLRDPEVAAALESGDTLSLLRNPAIRDLVDRVMEDDEPA